MHHMAFNAFDPVWIAFANLLIGIHMSLGISVTREPFTRLAEF